MNNKTLELLKEVAERYDLHTLSGILKNNNTDLINKDIFICLNGIVEAAESKNSILEDLKSSKNIYGSSIFAVNIDKGEYLIKNEPDFKEAIEKFNDYSFCFKLSPYHIINTFLALVVAQITGYDLNKLRQKGKDHIEESIRIMKMSSLESNAETKLIMPVGAAGCGKSTFFRELNNVVNISCDNIRYLLFKEYGPCFSSWESCLSWWIVNSLTDYFLNNGYNVFYNGVNTDKEYRSPMTMEDPDPLFKGIPYNIKIVYFEHKVNLNNEELEELKNINLWKVPIEELDITEYSANVAEILKTIEKNYTRTLQRTKEIKEGKKEQDLFDVLYAVPAPIVKLFVEQSFNRPEGNNVVTVKRKEIPDENERRKFYQQYATNVMAQ